MFRFWISVFKFHTLFFEKKRGKTVLQRRRVPGEWRLWPQKTNKFGVTKMWKNINLTISTHYDHVNVWKKTVGGKGVNKKSLNHIESSHVQIGDIWHKIILAKQHWDSCHWDPRSEGVASDGICMHLCHCLFSSPAAPTVHAQDHCRSQNTAAERALRC